MTMSSTRASAKGVQARCLTTRPKSTDALDRLSQGLSKISLQCKPLQQFRPSVTRKGPSVPDNLREVSRLELLLAPKQAEKVFTPAQDGPASQRVNRAIKMSAQWTDVQQAVGSPADVSPGNAAYAVHRLGCLASFASKKRNADLAASGLVPALVSVATADLNTLDAGSLTLLLDGCARLKHRPPTATLDALAVAAERMAATFDGSQLSLILWAFETLDYAPKESFLSAIDDAVERSVPGLSPQSICLALSGFRAAGHCPGESTLAGLAEGLHRMLPLFKPSEIATCLEAFSRFGYELAPDIVNAIRQRAGQPVHSNTSAGKRPLGNPVEGIIEKHARFVQQGPQTASKHVAAAEKLLRRASSEFRQSLEPRRAEWDAVRLG